MVNRWLAIFIAKTLVCCASLLVFATAALAASSVTVERIEVDGKAVAQLANVSMLATGSEAPVVQSLSEKDTVAERMQIIVPARTVITLKSGNSNTITLQPGSRFTVRHVGDDGESYTLDDGSVSFDVVKALDFFNVNYRKFLAIVKGTKFSVEVEPEKEIRFSVTEGTVVVEREVKVLIKQSGEEERTTEITAQDTIKAGNKDFVKCQLSVDEYLKRFDTFKGAEEYFRKQLEDAENTREAHRIALALNYLAGVFLETAKPRAAEAILERALALSRDDTPLQAASLYMLGAMHNHLQSKSRARTYFERALALYRSVADQTLTKCIACVENEIGRTYLDSGQPELAIAWFERAIATARLSRSGDTDQMIALAYWNIALTHLQGARYQSALEFARQALTIYERLFAGHPNQALANTYSILADIYAGTNDIAEAIKFAEATLMQRRRLFPEEDHPSVMSTYMKLGNLHLRAGELASAAANYERCRSILAALDPDERTKDWPILFSNLGLLESKRGNSKMAIEFGERALRASTAADGDTPSASTAVRHNNLGSSYKRSSDLPSAIKHFKQSLAILERIYPDQARPEIATNLYALGEVYYEQEKYDDALRVFEDAIRIWRTLYPAGNVNTVDALIGAGRAYSELFRADEAAARFREALTILRRQYPSGIHDRITGVLYETGEAFRLTKRWASAVEEYEAALDVYRKLYPDAAHVVIAKIQEKLATAYTELGNADKAQAFARQAAAMRERLKPSTPVVPSKAQ